MCKLRLINSNHADKKVPNVFQHSALNESIYSIILITSQNASLLVRHFLMSIPKYIDRFQNWKHSKRCDYYLEKLIFRVFFKIRRTNTVKVSSFVKNIAAH